MNSPESSPLGKTSRYIDQYDASLLFPIARVAKREELGLTDRDLPFHGVDIWNGYELSWLNLKGKPMVAIAVFYIPASSVNIIESKSFKLYLNSFNQSRFESLNVVSSLLAEDLTKAVGAEVKVALHSLNKAVTHEQIHQWQADCIDDLDIEITDYQTDASLLRCSDEQVQESLCSHLLKSNCLVTGQPDWGSVYIEYSGAKIDRESLLKYLISFRQHNEFHEQCVERIFVDLQQHCQCKSLTVYARYVRRGGLDINPFRSNQADAIVNNLRMVRQ
ncbi:NADPH-dependent 7-cyano-7-deazaguanine reductase QueF [Reinekea thalattae]|uniref:NADPH-dependent 7-cyano-7-deazaguanine reductase n=1 Tax=Reinekea thalattae TaxID=2593301 RepID=A0A5C8ZDG6_9GAMM|nr:NADPH-dependent 7-cyano-7-deazaguanine reductase QueF [Reinekea thalattae]TXR54966.1 NADPH-dependent 7-cyano-7-deazaguanine reductase QueF [Reinekea thalattae]